MTAVPPTYAEPFRPENDTERGRFAAFLGYILLLASVFTAGLSGFVAMILAFDRKSQSGPVAASHLGFQIKVFWLCFVLAFAAAALWIAGLLAMVHTPPPVIHYGAPDAQLVSIAAPLLQPVQVETWGYSFSGAPAELSPKARIEFSLGSAAALASVLLSWVAPIYGLARLASGRPIGDRRSRTAEPERSA